MTTIRPPSGPPFPDRMINPVCFKIYLCTNIKLLSIQIFPPTTNGLTPPVQFQQHTYQTNPPIFPPTQQYQPTLMNQHNPSQTPPLPSSNFYNTKANPTPPPTNLYNPLSVKYISL